MGGQLSLPLGQGAGSEQGKKAGLGGDSSRSAGKGGEQKRSRQGTNGQPLLESSGIGGPAPQTLGEALALKAESQPD